MIQLIKSFFVRLILLSIIIALYIPAGYAASEQVVNVFNWTKYLPDDVIAKFEHETGIKVHYSTYDSNAKLYAKLKASHQQEYDLIVPSASYVERLRKEKMLTKLDLKKIPNSKNLNPDLLNRAFDKHNQYSLPYMWGFTGIVINKKYYSTQQIHAWKTFWSSKLKDQLVMLNSAQEVFSITFKAMGLPANDKKPNDIKRAYQKLVTLLPNIKLFNSEASQSIYMDEDASIGMCWNGDAYTAMQANPNIIFVYPKEGVSAWIDNLAIPKGAPHLANAYKFINFLLRPDVAKQIALEIPYSSPNLAAIKLFPKAVRESYVLYPNHQQLKNAEFQQDLGSANKVYQHYWQMLKIG